MDRYVVQVEDVIAIVGLFRWLVYMYNGPTYGVVLEIDVSIMSILISLPSVIS